MLHSVLAQSLFATRLFNVTVTNVPGPQQTLYAFGAPMRRVIPLVPLAAEHAVGIAAMSYDGRVCLCVHADRDTVPDVAVVTAGIEAELQALRELSIATAGAHATMTSLVIHVRCDDGGTWFVHVADGPMPSRRTRARPTPSVRPPSWPARSTA